jgi:hypothetical protein
MNIILFDDTKSYQYYKDYNNNYELINISNFNTYKKQIINTLNQIITNEIILDNYISKFYITNLRDNKYMFIYVLDNTLSINNSFINLTYQINQITLSKRPITLHKFLNYEIYTSPENEVLNDFYYGKLCSTNAVINDIIYLNKIIYSYDKDAILNNNTYKLPVYYSLDLYNTKSINIDKLNTLKVSTGSNTFLYKTNFTLTTNST